MGAFVTPPGQPLPMQAGEFQEGSSPSVVSFAFEEIDPPAGLYISRDDQLVLQVSQPGAAIADTITVAARLLLPLEPQRGQPDTALEAAPAHLPGAYIATIIRTIQTTGIAGASSQLVIPLSEGYLLSVAVLAATTTTRGQTFARVFLSRGPLGTTASNVGLMLLADYVSALGPVGWPGGRCVYPTEGPGNLRFVQVSNPAAGVDWSATVPNGTRWRLQNLSALFTTSAAVATRFPRLLLKDAGGHIVFQSCTSNGSTASLPVQYTAASSQLYTVTTSIDRALLLPLPCILTAGQTISTNTFAIDVADQWSAIWLSVEEWADLF